MKDTFPTSPSGAPVPDKPLANPRAARIHERLRRLIGEGPAAFYLDAIRLMSASPPLPTGSHLVGHLMREIESSVRSVLRTRDDFSDEEKKKRHQVEVQNVLAFLGVADDDPLARVWLELAKRENDQSLHQVAHRNALKPPRPIDADFRVWFDRIERLLDAILEKFEPKYLEAVARLDDLLAKKQPGEKDASFLLNRVPHNLVVHTRFFERNNNPAWLRPLKEKGFFRAPPAVDRNEEKATIRFPPWPESAYLARMARLPEAQAEVLEIAMAIPDTDNVAVHQDLTELACSIPASMAVRLAGKAKQWACGLHVCSWVLSDRLGALIEHLARGGEVDAALDLARSLLEIQPDPRYQEVTEAPEEIPGPLPEPRARFDSWEYAEILKKRSPALVEVAGERALVLLCDLLDDAVRLSQRRSMHHGPDDLSNIWRRAIEPHEQNHDHEVADHLVSAVRDAAEMLATRDRDSVPRVVEILESRAWKISHRIALHLIRRFAEAAPDLVAARLTKYTCFDDPHLRHEYVLLARERFGGLDAADKRKILAWIEEGNERVNESPRRKRIWQRDRLAPIADSLPEEWSRKYQELRAELGEAEHPEFTSYVTSWVGPTSPKNEGELGAMALDAIVAFLSSWPVPEDMHFAPSPEGLGRTLTKVVAAEPARFAEGADKFKGQDPTYVRAVIQGFEEAAKNGREFPWLPVLDLCAWIVGRDVGVPDKRREALDLDPDWSWARGAVAWLLCTGFNEGSCEIPLAFRERVWDVLKPLTEDQDGGEDRLHPHGPIHVAINCVRGKALQAVMRYAWWVRRSLEQGPDAQVRLKRGFDEMQEVREILDVHLDNENERSLAIRSVYGQWFPHLSALDKGWAETNVDRIFPAAPEQEAYWTTAWDAYLFYNHVYTGVFPLLRREYERAVVGLATPKPGAAESREEENRRLARHVMNLYGLGKTGLESGSLLDRFFLVASADLRGEAIEFLGRMALHNREDGDKPLSSEFLNRLMALWNSRLEAAKASQDASSFAPEMGGFVWWFCAGVFEESWAIEQLAEALTRSASNRGFAPVEEYLEDAVTRHPREAIQCLDVLLRQEPLDWRLLGSKRNDSTRQILSCAIQGPDADAREIAIALVNYLGTRGHWSYCDLLR